MDLSNLDTVKFTGLKTVIAYAFDPKASDEDMKIMLDYLLKYKSICLTRPSGFNQPRTEEAIKHLANSCVYESSPKDNPYAHIMRNPIMVTFIGGILVLIAWKYISPYINAL